MRSAAAVQVDESRSSRAMEAPISASASQKTAPSSAAGAGDQGDAPAEIHEFFEPISFRVGPVRHKQLCDIEIEFGVDIKRAFAGDTTALTRPSKRPAALIRTDARAA